MLTLAHRSRQLNLGLIVCISQHTVQQLKLGNRLQSSSTLPSRSPCHNLWKLQSIQALRADTGNCTSCSLGKWQASSEDSVERVWRSPPCTSVAAKQKNGKTRRFTPVHISFSRSFEPAPPRFSKRNSCEAKSLNHTYFRCSNCEESRCGINGGYWWRGGTRFRWKIS
jgi:hypothetical protein